MMPDSMRIHLRKCNASTPQKPSKKQSKRRPRAPVPKMYQSEQAMPGNNFHQDSRNVPNMRSEKSHPTRKLQTNHKRNFGKESSNNSKRQVSKEDYSSQLSKKTKSFKKNANQYGTEPTRPNKQSNKRQSSGYGKTPDQNSRRGVQKVSNYDRKPVRETKRKPKYDDFNISNDQAGARNTNQARKRNQAYGKPTAKHMNSGKERNTIDEVAFAKTEQEMGPPPSTNLGPCRICGRTFAVDRLPKHQKACVKASKKPKKIKIFHKKITAKEKKKFKKAGKSSKWKHQHQEFITQMKYMKKLKEVEARGGDIREIAPMPASENPDLIPCKFCDRKFREAAHERHEGICQRVFGGKKGNAMKSKKPPGMANRGGLSKTKQAQRRRRF